MEGHVAYIRLRRKADPFILLNQKKRGLRVARIERHRRRYFVLFQQTLRDRSRILLWKVQDEFLIMKF